MYSRKRNGIFLLIVDWCSIRITIFPSISIAMSRFGLQTRWMYVVHEWNISAGNIESKTNLYHELWVSLQCKRTKCFRKKTSSECGVLALMFTFAFGISYRKYSIRTHCVLIYHSCKRFFFSIFYENLQRKSTKTESL